MKKIITLLLSMCLALTCTVLFVACDKKDPVDPLAAAKTEATTYVENAWADLTDLGIDLSSYTARYEAVKSDITAATTEDQIASAKTTFDSLKTEITAANALKTAKTNANTYVEDGWAQLQTLSIDLTSYTERYNKIKSDISSAETVEAIDDYKADFDTLKTEIEAANAVKELADAKTAAIASLEASWKALKNAGVTLTSYETQYNQIKTAINAAATKEKVAEYKASFDTLATGIKAEHDAAVAFAAAKAKAVADAESVWNSLSDQGIDLTAFTERYNTIKLDLSAATTQEQLASAKASFDNLLAEIEEENAAAVAFANAKTKLLADVAVAWDELVEEGIVLTTYVNDYEAIKANITAATDQEQLDGYKASFNALVAKINADQTPDTFIFEAEAADLEVVNTGWGIRRGYEIGSGVFSGTGYLGNWQSTENAIIFSIESDRATKAVVGMRVGFRYDRMLIFGDTGACFSGVLVNDSPIDLPEDAYFEPVTAEDGPNYFAWGNRELFTIDLVKGTNTIRFDLAGKNINWDYLYLTTVAELSLTSEKEGHNYSDWVVTKMPTAEEEGRMFRQCDVCCGKEVVTLPVLSDAYTVQVTRQATETSSELTTYTVDGRSFVVESTPASGAEVAIKIEAESGLSSIWTGGAALTTESNGGKTFVSINCKKGTLSYTFNSAATGTASLVFNLAPHMSSSCYANSVFTLQVNGKTIAIDDTLSIEKDGNGWFNVKDFIIATFEVQEGKNTIVIETSGQQGGNNLDYLLIKSAAFEEEVLSLTVKTKPTKFRYVAGESFDATGMVIEALYNTGRIETVTDYTVDKTVLAVEDTEVTLSYGGLSAKVSVTVSEEQVEPTKYTFTYKDIVATNTGYQDVKVENDMNYGNVQGNTFTITVNCAKATTVEFIFNGARTNADYTISDCFSTFTVNGIDKKSDIPGDSLKDVFKGWTTPVDFTVCTISLAEGENVISFKMGQNVNLFALSFLSTEEITVVSPETVE